MPFDFTTTAPESLDSSKKNPFCSTYDPTAPGSFEVPIPNLKNNPFTIPSSTPPSPTAKPAATTTNPFGAPAKRNVFKQTFFQALQRSTDPNPFTSCSLGTKKNRSPLPLPTLPEKTSAPLGTKKNKSPRPLPTLPEKTTAPQDSPRPNPLVEYQDSPAPKDSPRPNPLVEYQDSPSPAPLPEKKPAYNPAPSPPSRLESPRSRPALVDYEISPGDITVISSPTSRIHPKRKMTAKSTLRRVRRRLTL